MNAAQLDALRPRLRCPDCRGSLAEAPGGLGCRECGRNYAFRDGQLRFGDAPARTDATDDLKGRLKQRLGASYHRLLKPLFSPSYPLRIASICRPYLPGPGGIAVEVGSGNQRIQPGVLSLDFFPYPHVDIVCDARSLPFTDGSVELVISNTVLEHVHDIDAVLGEIQRITRPGSVNVHVVPFLYPFHASPDDFRRYTHVGLAALFPGWQVLRQANVTGPFTLFNAVVAEVLSILLSFGASRLRGVLYLLFCALLSPLKFLDVLFVNRASFVTVAPTILTVLRKPEALPAGGGPP